MEHEQEIEITIGEPIAAKVLDTCVGTDNRRYYKIQWQATWEAEEDILLKYQPLVEEYWRFSDARQQKQENLFNIEVPGGFSVKVTEKENKVPPMTDSSLNDFYKPVNSPEHKIKEIPSLTDNFQNNKPPPLMPEKWQYANRPFQCEICLRCYTSEKKTEEHKRKLHMNKVFYQCTYCSKKFATKRNLQNHMNRHTGIGPHPCPGCSKRYMTEKELEHHKRSCNGLVEKEFQCNICSKAFATKPHLSFHMKIHLPDDQKPFKCQYCPRTFAYNHDCIHHMRLHIGEKPFKCSECREAFHRKSYLTEHMFIHTGISKYRCLDCEQYFKTQQMLQTHVKNVHILKKTIPSERKKTKNERRYRCEDCDKVFRFMKEYHYHLAVNHKDAFHLKNKNNIEYATFEPTMVYKCKQCDKTFQWPSALKKHAETHKQDGSLKNYTYEDNRNFSEIKEINPRISDQLLETADILIIDPNNHQDSIIKMAQHESHKEDRVSEQQDCKALNSNLEFDSIGCEEILPRNVAEENVEVIKSMSITEIDFKLNDFSKMISDSNSAEF